MTNSSPHYIEDDNLSRAWGRAILQALASRREVVPLIVSVSGFEDGVPIETPVIRQALDGLLLDCQAWSVKTVASTIFPLSLWNPKRPRSTLYGRYRRIYPRLKKVSANRRGTYFGRMIDEHGRPPNQLEFSISSYKYHSKRRSKLQVNLFDPETDHSPTPLLGFPCLQHITFAPTATDGLSVLGVYANQYLIQRAYGNYLGLAHLGQFVAAALGLRLTRVTCTAGIAQVEDKTAKRTLSLKYLQPLADVIRGQIELPSTSPRKR